MTVDTNARYEAFRSNALAGAKLLSGEKGDAGLCRQTAFFYSAQRCEIVQKRWEWVGKVSLTVAAALLCDVCYGKIVLGGGRLRNTMYLSAGVLGTCLWHVSNGQTKAYGDLAAIYLAAKKIENADDLSETITSYAKLVRTMGVKHWRY